MRLLASILSQLHLEDIDLERLDHDRLKAALLELASVFADATETRLDDLLIETLKDAGVDDDVLEGLKPDRIQ